MTCLICKQGQTAPGHVSVTLEREGCTVIFRNVPADVCGNCGEYYLCDEVSSDLMRRAEEAARRGTEVEILSFAA